MKTRFCPHCATPLEFITLLEDSGDKERLRCGACVLTHWNNPTPVLAAIVEARWSAAAGVNALWPPKMFTLITGFHGGGRVARG